MLWLNATPELAALLIEYGIHYGFDLDDDGLDRGLSKVFPRKGFYGGGIASFLSSVSWEAASFADAPGITIIWHPHADEEARLQAKRDLPERMKVSPTLEALEPAIEWLRQEYGDLIRLRSDRRRMPVLLVKSPEVVVTHLREHGHVHFGRWLDEATKIDRGLISAFSKPCPSLDSWFRVLEREAREEGVPVGVYHPKADTESVATCGRPVVVIDALTAEEAIEQIAKI